jgi:hypothetical protein
MHPAWLRCESLKDLDIPALSRLARQAPQQLKMVIYFCANPKLHISSAVREHPFVAAHIFIGETGPVIVDFWWWGTLYVSLTS